jgi:predicted transcriptional regulator
MKSKTPSKRLTDAHRHQLERFAKLLNERMRAQNVSVAKLAKHASLRTETVRAYVRGLNRPTKSSLRRLSMILGDDVALPFAGTELAGADEEPYSFTYVNNEVMILTAHVALTREAASEVMDVFRKHHVGESLAPYAREKHDERKR